MSLLTRKRGERGDENAGDSDRAIQPNPRRQHTDNSGDDADSEGSWSATSRIWMVLQNPSTYPNNGDIDFQPEAFLDLIFDVITNRAHGAQLDLLQLILCRPIFYNLFKRYYPDHWSLRGEEDVSIDEPCLIHWIRSFAIKGGSFGIKAIDAIVSYILFIMWEHVKDWSVDKHYLIEWILDFILEEDDQLDYLYRTKQSVSLIGEIIGEKDAQIGKLHLIWRFAWFISKPLYVEDDSFLFKARVMEWIAYYVGTGLISKKDDPVYGLNLIDRTVSFFLDVKRAEKDGQVDKLCLIERIVSFINDIIGEKDGQVDKLCQIKQIVNLFEGIYNFHAAGLEDELKLMKHSVTLVEMMIKGEKNDQVDKLRLIKQIISFLKDDELEVDKLEVTHHIVSWIETKLLGHGSSRSVDETFDGELEGRIMEVEQPMEAPTHDTINDEPTMTTRATELLEVYKGKSKYRKYFMMHEDGIHWLCILCEDINPPKKELLKRNKYGSTTIFQRHLKKYHMDIYKDI